MRTSKMNKGATSATESFARGSLSATLRRWFRRSRKSPGRSIAVLPFKNMSADPENEYFSDGLSEAIINTLSRIHAFKVVARTSAFSFKGRDVDIRDIGRRLAVENVLEGSVQKSANRLRITAQLISVADGYHLWSERFDRSLDDVFAIQDEISLAIVDKLKIKPLDQERKRIVKRHTKDPESYNLYLKGRYFYNKRTEEDLKRSIENFQAAIDRDPVFALPYAGLADTYSTMGFYHWLTMAEAKAKANEAASRGLEIDGTIGETHAAYANVILWYDWRLAKAEEEYKKALELSPSDVEAHHMYAHLLESAGRQNEALAEMGRALELEPLSINLNTCLAQIHFFARRTDAAIERLQKTIEMDPGFPLHYFYLGRSYLEKGAFEEAIAMFEKGKEFPATGAIALCGLAYGYAISGRKDEAKKILDQLNNLSAKTYVSPYYMAFIHAGLKDKEKVFTYLEEAYDEGDMYLFYLKVDPAFEEWHSDRRFIELLNKTGLAGFPGTGAKTPQRSQDALTKTSTGKKSGLGTIVAHYRLIEKIGEGGMGVVYKAEDTKLKRTVALKFLPPEMMRDKVAKARFLREAQTAAALDHPNICTIFEINEEGGRTFISMAYIEGTSLKEKISQGPIKVDEAKAIALQVAEGLRAAHARGVIHRDIKPANIMLTPEGQAKIMDFGLAKFDRGIDVTQTAAVMGTIAYMSPEQARGEALDRRTDIWSFGTVLYEMLSRRLPFGKRPEQLMYFAILNEKPESLSAARPDIPRALEQVVMKALEKEPARRHQSMGDFLNDLRGTRSSTTAATPSQPKKSIIVLPFENISPDPDQEYFCDGMTEEIITDLSHIRDLLVISRNSAMTFKGTKKKTREIAMEANVRYVLEGSVRKAGNSLRITSQLIDAESDAHLWAEKYTGSLDDVFDIQEKVSRAIADALKIRLSPKEDARMNYHPIENIKAYECYLQARQEIWRFTEKGLERGLQLLRNGLDIIGENVLLYATMGTAFYLYVDAGIKPGELYLRKAEDCIQKIFELDPDSSHGHYLLGSIQLLRGNMQQAVRDFKKALAREPDNPDCLLQLVRVYCSCGRESVAEPLLDKVLAVDPLNTIIHSLPGYIQLLRGRYDSAAESYHKMYLMDPESPIFRWFYAWALIFAKQNQKSFEIIDQLASDFPGTTFASYGLLVKYALTGRKQVALQMITPELEAAAKGVEYHSRGMANLYALLGEKDKALDWLENTVDRGFIHYPFLSELDPFLASIRGETRFQKLMERVKREWETFEV